MCGYFIFSFTFSFFSSFKFAFSFETFIYFFLWDLNLYFEFACLSILLRFFNFWRFILSTAGVVSLCNYFVFLVCFGLYVFFFFFYLSFLADFDFLLLVTVNTLLLFLNQPFSSYFYSILSFSNISPLAFISF